jgi:L-aminopeptidase/D-esterase-like protein
MVYDALLDHLPDDDLPPVEPVVGETWDAVLNDIEGRHVHKEHVDQALHSATGGPVAEGNVGGGTGMKCYDFKGGIGTASRKLPPPLQAYSVGVLVQANHGERERLRVDGVPIGEEIQDLRSLDTSETVGNSILMIIATDAPLLDYQLNRLARRACHGLAKTGSISRNDSGDFTLAFSTGNPIPRQAFWRDGPYELNSVDQDYFEPLLQAVSEATEEAILNALFMASDMEGRDGNMVFALPLERTLSIVKRHHRLFPPEDAGGSDD